MKKTKKIFDSPQKNDGAVDHSTISKWLKKFRSGCKNLIEQARSGWPKKRGFRAHAPKSKKQIR